jgi:hypothetical protein
MKHSTKILSAPARQTCAASQPTATDATAHSRQSSPDKPSKQPPMVLVLPGLSLMSRVQIVGGVRVRCSGCGAVQDIHGLPGGGVLHGNFVHERDDCPILVRINEALRRYEQITKVRFN